MRNVLKSRCIRNLGKRRCRLILAGRGQINEGTRIGGEKGSPGAEVASLSVEHYSSNWKLIQQLDQLTEETDRGRLCRRAEPTAKGS